MSYPLFANNINHSKIKERNHIVSQNIGKYSMILSHTFYAKTQSGTTALSYTMQVLNPFKRLKLKVTIKKGGNIANMGGRASAIGVLLVMLEALTEVSGSAEVMVTMRPPA